MSYLILALALLISQAFAKELTLYCTKKGAEHAVGVIQSGNQFSMKIFTVDENGRTNFRMAKAMKCVTDPTILAKSVVTKCAYVRGPDAGMRAELIKKKNKLTVEMRETGPRGPGPQTALKCENW